LLDVEGTPKRAHKLLFDDADCLDIKSLDLPSLEKWVVEELGEKKFRARQVYKWIWQKQVASFDEMTNVAKTLRAVLKERAIIRWLVLEKAQHSVDGCRKFLWRLEDGLFIESVLIPEEARLTLCISSQVGCAMGCTFCLTGHMGLKRQLKPSEIVNQVIQVQSHLPEEMRITNLVLMGMGEPLHNLSNVVSALAICLDDHALNFSHRKITVSTAGLVPKMAELAAALPVNLAVSLNATTEEQRREIMPITNKYSLKALLDACREFPLPAGKRITFEYVLFDDFNDSLDDARRLYSMLKGIKAKVNLIPYNANPDTPREFGAPTAERVKAFQNYFVQRQLNCTVRASRGTDISAACGQLGAQADKA
jgi:23S rRNA (adenine2503-C2)-methyltransferase